MLASIIAASNKAIMGLKEVVLTKDDACAICFNVLVDRYQEDNIDGAASVELTMSTLRAMPCSHVFHRHCIFQWLRLNAVCPLYHHQLQLPTTNDDEEEGGGELGE
jgi:hypothetical protein